MSKIKKRQPSSAQMIQNALMDLLKEKEFCEIPIYEICEKATVSRNTFYRIFRSKEEVLDALVIERIRQVRSLYEENRITNFYSIKQEEIIRTYILHYTYWKEQEELLLVLVKRGLFKRFIELFPLSLEVADTEELLEIHYKTEKQAGEAYFRSWLSVGLALLLEEWTKQNFYQTPVQMAEMTLNMFRVMGTIAGNK